MLNTVVSALWRCWYFFLFWKYAKTTNTSIRSLFQ